LDASGEVALAQQPKPWISQPQGITIRYFAGRPIGRLRGALLPEGALPPEMELHRQYARKFDISREELEQTEPAATTLAYTHYMLQVSQNGTLAELMASLVPCSWGYYDIGKRLNDIPGAAEHEFYGEWVKLYGGQEFEELAEWTIQLLNDAARDKPEGELRRLEEIFLTTSRFEYMFCEIAYKKDMWPLDER
jgi:thiaminase (transcriptional activator TenA)